MPMNLLARLWPKTLVDTMHVNFAFVIYYDLFISTTVYTLTDHFHLPLCRQEKVRAEP